MTDPVHPVGEVIAEYYVVERELGQGGMATVYLCSDRRTNGRVAVKILRSEIGSAVVVERFLREIAYASELDHPRIPKVLGSGVVDGLPYYVMTYIDGESLRTRLDREKQLPIADAARIACEVVGPTAYAHERGIIHRDIKPDNILLTQEGVYVLDFGIARAIVESGADRLTSTGIGVGTPAYMSPEQALGERNLDGRSDIYSLGCVLYEMIAGVPPFVGPTAQVIVSRRFGAAPLALGEFREAVPEALERVVAQALAKSPVDRWKTTSEFGSALTPFCVSPLNKPIDRPFYSRFRDARRATKIVLSLGALAAIVGATWLVGRALNRTTRNARIPGAVGTVAVIPFRINATDGAYGFLRKGMVDLLSATLSNDAPLWRAVDPDAVFRKWSAHDSDKLGQEASIEASLRFATELGATRAIRGVAAGSRGQLFLTASLLEIPGGASLGTAEVSGTLDSVPSLVDRLAAQLLTLQAGENQETLPVLTGTPLAAVRAYLAGREAFRRGDYVKSIHSHETALSIDSSFALAAAGLGRTAGWLGDDAARRRGYEVAWKNRRRLGPVDRAVVRAVLGPHYPAGSTRTEWLSAWEDVARLQPEAPEGWYEVGDLLFHNPSLGTRDNLEGFARARALFARALDRAPNYWPAFQHLLQVSAHDGDTAEVRRLARRAASAGLNSDLDAFVRWRSAQALGDTAELRIAWDELQRAGLLPLHWITMTSLADGIAVSDASRALDIQLRRAVTQKERLDALLARHAYNLNVGHLKDAAATTSLITANALGQRVGRELQILDVLYGAMPLDRSSERALAEMSVDSSPPVAGDAEREGWATDRCVLAQWHIVHKDVRAMEAMISQLRAAATQYPQELWSSAAQSCMALLRAATASYTDRRVAGASYDSLEATLAEGPYMSSLLWHTMVLASTSLFESAGELQRAERALRRAGFFFRWPHYLARQRWEEGKFALLAGDRVGSAKAYSDYLALRTQPDSSLLSEVGEVRKALARQLK